MDGSNRFTGGKFRSYALVLLLVGFWFSGFHGFLFTSQGRRVPPRDRIELVSHGQQLGSWQTRSVWIQYRYVRSPNQLHITGRLRFGSYLRNVYHYIVYFHSGVLLLNKHGRVLATKNLMTTNAYAHTTDSVPFHANYHLPRGTTAFAFTYTGSARGIPDGSTSFFHYP